MYIGINTKEPSPCAFTLAVNGGTSPYTFSVSGNRLPEGLALSDAGVILGTPTVSANVTFSITVQDANEALDTKEFTVTVSPTASAIGGGDVVLGVSAIQVNDKIYFGQYTSGGAYNVPWFVLDKTADSATLLSEYILSNSTFRSGLYGYYPESALNETMRAFYYDYGANLLFNAKEKTAIGITTLAGESMYSGQSDLTGQLLYPLSYPEVESIGWENPLLLAKYITNHTGSAGEWWLRSSSLYNEAWSVSNTYSDITHNPNIIRDVYDSCGVRPAFNLNLNSVLFSSAAAAGKISGLEGANALTQNLQPSDTTEWKLTLLDTDRSSFAITTTSLTDAAATVNYQGAATGANEYISATIVNDGGDVLYYGRIKRLPAETDASGNVTINIPGDVTLGSNATLKVFNEQCNSDFRTDFASQQITVTATFEPPADNACEIGGVQYAALDEALAAATNGQTIKLINNITYTSSLEVDGRTIYFELGDYNLLVDISGNPDESISYAITVKNGGKIKLSGTGTGQFNVKGSSSSNGINVLGWNSEVTVNNVDAPGAGAAAINMYGSGSYLDGGRITVNGNITADNTGIQVNARNANIVVNGDITAGHSGISIATNPGTTVTVNGNITVLGNESQDQQGTGVRANGGSTVTVSGNVDNQGINNIGVFAYGGTIEVGGDVVSSGIGAKAEKNYSYGDGKVTVNGSLSAGTPFIVVGTTDKTPDQITEPTSKSGFRTYTDGISNVWIASVGDRVFSAPGMPQNFAAAPGDGQAALGWDAPANDGGRAILKYQVSKDNGANWVDAGLNTSYTFTGLTNGTEYTFRVRAVNSEGNGLEADATATPRADICRIGETGYATLDEALEAIGEGETETITLLNSINHNRGITLDNQKVTFELNGYTLNVVSSNEYVPALGVYNGGGVALSGTGALNVTGPANACGVTVHSNSALSEVTVTNASASGPESIAAHAYGNASLIVLGDAVATGPRSFGVHAQEDSVIEVRGNVGGDNQGVCVSGATARVSGNVVSNGLDLIENPEGIGVNVYDGVAEVGGNVTANRVGAMIRAGGSIQIEGTLTSPDYIQFNDDDPVAIDDYVTPTTIAGYRTYRQGDNTVWIKGESVSVRYSVTVENDGNGTATADFDSAAEGEEITLTSLPEDGYRFKEWEVISGGVTVSENRFVMTGSDVTLKAIFEPVSASTHTVNFFSDSSLYVSKTITGGSAPGTDWPTDPERSGYSFGGWFTAQNGTGTLYTSASIITADTALYAKWTYNGGEDPGDAGGTPVIPADKAYIKAENGTESTLPVTVDEDSGNASVEAGFKGSDYIITIPSIANVDMYTVSVPVSDLSTGGARNALTVKTDVGSFTVPSNMLAGISGISGSKAQITIGRGDKSNLPEDIKDALGDRPLVQLTLSIDGKQTNWSDQKTLVRVSIPYTPTADELENPENIVIWYIDGENNIISVPSGKYDPDTGTVSFNTNHFSFYAVSYNHSDFKDLANDAWYAKAVSFIAARGITAGTGGGNFSPEAKLTRGQCVVMLVRAFDLAPDDGPADNFADAGNTYYTDCLLAAKGLGIVNGIGNNLFAPEKEISRQEMFVMLYNALRVMNEVPATTNSVQLTDFNDGAYVADWANEALTSLVKAGVVGGYNNNLNTTSTTTRAEIAQVLYNLLSK